MEPQTNVSKWRGFLCHVCGKSYIALGQLNLHLRFHEGIKPFACEVPGCDRKYTLRKDLNDHKRKFHTGERPYLCEECGERFFTGSVFYHHRLKHRGDRRHECDVCGKKFYSSSALKDHRSIHTGEKLFGCKYCGKTYRQRAGRSQHLRTKHGNLQDD